MPPRIPPPTRATISGPSSYNLCRSCLRRSFSVTRQPQGKSERAAMFAWLGTAGKNFQQPNTNQTNYLPDYKREGNYAIRRPTNREGGSKPRFDNSNAPKSADSKALEDAAVDDSSGDASMPRPVFPQNINFYSESILSEQLRMEVHKRVQIDKQSVRQVSAELNIDMRRVGAVVRLVEIEQRMRAQNQQLAIPYAEAIYSMVPVTSYNRDKPAVHESINDLPHHPLTAPQIFYPTSESRAFNRTDAGRVFSAAPRLPDSQDIGQGGRPKNEPWQDTRTEIIGKKGHEMPVLKPADARIPHSHLIKHEQDKLDPNIGESSREVQLKYEQRLKEDSTQRAEMFRKREAMKEQLRTRLEKGKWEWVVTDVQAERGNVGTRYGVPSQDRKRGNVKIPTRVEV